MERYWEDSADRLQQVLSALPEFDATCSDGQIQAQLAEAEQFVTDDIKPVAARFAAMDSKTFMSVVATWRDKYRR